jgi:iron transport multicopper oxidase
VELTVNDILVLNVQNNLNEATVLHAHGLRQKGYNLMDGAGMVTQWYAF